MEKTSLADFILLWKAPVVLISSPEYGLDDQGTFTAPAMTICENLNHHLKKDKFLKSVMTLAVDFAGSTSGEFCKSRVRWVQDGNEIYEADAHPFSDDKKNIENSFWGSYWRGKVDGALTACLIHMGDRKLPGHEKKRETFLGGEKMSQKESQGACFRGIPGKWKIRVVVAVSIDGGPITQVEKSLIPCIRDNVISDLHRRGFSWSHHAHVVWCSFPSVKDLVRSMAGERNLAKQDNLTYSVAYPSREPSAPSLLKASVEDAMKEAPPVTAANMLAAVREGDLETVQFAVSKGISVNSKSLVGQLATGIACEHGQPDILQFFLQKDAEIECTDDKGHSPLSIAVLKCQKDCVEMLIAAKADVNKPFNGQSLLELCEDQRPSKPEVASDILQILKDPGCQ